MLVKALENELSIGMPLTCKKYFFPLHRTFSKIQNLTKLIQKDFSQFEIEQNSSYVLLQPLTISQRRVLPNKFSKSYVFIDLILELLLLI